MEPKLKAGLWVKAQIRRCDVEMIPIAVVRRGDADAGTVILKLNRMDGTCDLLSQTRDMDGRPAWMRPISAALVPEAKADEYIERQASRDPDFWVVEIEDARGTYEPDEPII